MWLESSNGYLLPLVLHERRGPVVGPVVPPHVVDQLELEEARELQGEGADQGDQDELVVRLPGDQRVANGLKNKKKNIMLLNICERKKTRKRQAKRRA